MSDIILKCSSLNDDYYFSHCFDNEAFVILSAVAVITYAI